jgi:hypothetical protein
MLSEAVVQLQQQRLMALAGRPNVLAPPPREMLAKCLADRRRERGAPCGGRLPSRTTCRMKTSVSIGLKQLPQCTRSARNPRPQYHSGSGEWVW